MKFHDLGWGCKLGGSVHSVTQSSRVLPSWNEHLKRPLVAPALSAALAGALMGN